MLEIAPHEWRWWPVHILWAICYIDYLGRGEWPDPYHSGYIDIPIKGGRHKAAFETPVMLSAEINLRLKRCSRDGLVLMCYYYHQMTVEDISLLMREDTVDAYRKMKRALAYCRGKARKPDYKEFSRHYSFGRDY